MKNILFSSILGILLFSTLALATAGSISITSVTIPTSVSVGDSFSITIAVSGSQASDVQGSLTLPTGLSCTEGTQSISLSGSGTGSATWSCSASVAGDYTNRISVSVTATDSGTGGSLSDSDQTGLTVVSPASLTASSSISSSSVVSGSSVTFTVGVNNAGGQSTTYSISLSCPTGLSCSPSSVASNSIDGNTLENNAFTITGSTVGSYTLTATVSGNSQSLATSKSLTVTAAGTTTTDSGGGGGGAATSAAAKIKVTTQRGKATITVPSIAAGKMANATINKTEDFAISRIEITVKNSVNNIQIIITKLDGKPVSIVHEIVGKVYHYIEINKTNITDTDVNKTKINFKVERSWLTANNINESTIALNRYADGKWNKLTATQVSSDATDIYFEAESPGLSVFAISGEEKVTAPAAPTAPGEEEKPEGEKGVGEILKKPSLIYVYIIVPIVIIALVFFLKKKNLLIKKKNQ